MPKKTALKNKKPKKEKEKVAEEKLSLSQEEFEKKVLALAEKGLTSEKIGEALRKEGIHSQEYKGKISKVLKAKGLYTSPDWVNVEKKLGRIKEHYSKNKQDKRAMREKDRIFSQLRSIKKYHKAL